MHSGIQGPKAGPGAPRCLSLRQAQHHVGDDACNRDVEPERKGPAGDFAVLGNAAGKRKEEGDEHQRQSDDRQNDVARQERQVHGAQRRMERVANVAVQRVMRDVADQKQRGKDEGRDHERAVGLDFAGADEGVTDEQGGGAKAVEYSVERGKKSVFAGGRGSGMNIDEPEEKQAGRHADCQNGGDGRAGSGSRLSSYVRSGGHGSLRLRPGAEHERGEEQG